MKIRSVWVALGCAAMVWAGCGDDPAADGPGSATGDDSQLGGLPHGAEAASPSAADASAADAGAAGGRSGSDTVDSSACTTPTDVSLNDSVTGSGLDHFAYQGSWDTSNGSGKYQGDDHYTSSAAASVQVRFQGDGVSLHAAKASHHGIAVVSLDGASAVDVDLYAADRGDDVAVWSQRGLSAGEHVLEISASGRKNAASSGTTITIDRLVISQTQCDAGASQVDAGADSTTRDAGSGQEAGSGTMGENGGSMERPSYNTGSGFFVVGDKLYDKNGMEFRIRGLNKLHWDADSPGIPNTHANTVRWVIDFTRSAADNVALVRQSIDNHIVPMPGSWDGTCKQDTTILNDIVDTWVAQADQWKTLDDSMILNIANEWGPSSSTSWRDAYIDAIAKLRAAGYLSTIAIDSGGCGQDNDDLAQYAKAVFDSDPQKNVIFSQHIYGGWSADGGNGQVKLTDALDRLVATGLPMIVGEFGPGRGIGPSPTDLTPRDIMQACETRGLGWLAWAWDDPAGNADDSWFALSTNGRYDSSSDLTMFGKAVVEDPTYGLLTLAKPATFF